MAAREMIAALTDNEVVMVALAVLPFAAMAAMGVCVLVLRCWASAAAIGGFLAVALWVLAAHAPEEIDSRLVGGVVAAGVVAVSVGAWDASRLSKRLDARRAAQSEIASL